MHDLEVARDEGEALRKKYNELEERYQKLWYKQSEDYLRGETQFREKMQEALKGGKNNNSTTKEVEQTSKMKPKARTLKQDDVKSITTTLSMRMKSKKVKIEDALEVNTLSSWELPLTLMCSSWLD